MTHTFSHGYALLIGVGESAYPKWSLPVTVKDMHAIQSILTDPTLCGYLNDEQHIRLLYDAGASRQAIVDGLTWLKEQAAADTEATIIVYYSGHGWLDQSTGEYYLIQHDIEAVDIPDSAVSAQAFTEAIRQICAKRLLVIIDSCHAQGMATAKDKIVPIKLPTDFAQTALPKQFIEELKQGEGRVVFTSSRGTQSSWIRADGAMSVYTYHLIEALQGAGNQPGDTVVRVSNLMNYLGKAVPETVQHEYQQEQIPFFDLATEDFAVSLLRGGKGLPEKGWEAVEADVAETMGRIIAGRDVAIASGTQTVDSSGSGNVNFGNIARAGEIRIEKSRED